MSYGRHHHGGLGGLILLGFGLAAGFYIFRAVMLGLIMLCAVIWAITANWYAIPRWVIRVGFIAAMVIALGFLLAISLGDTP